ncbi:MAG: hypothetical protein WBQ10_14140 [Terriglobales bacterium]
MAFPSSVPLILTAAIESVGVCLLALEVLIGHLLDQKRDKISDLLEDFSPLQRLQFFFAAQDYRGFWIESRLQQGRPPAEVTEMVNALSTSQLQNAVDAQWTTLAPQIAQKVRAMEPVVATFKRYTSPTAMRIRRTSLVSGTLLILVATWLTFLREHASPSTSVDHHESASADMSPVLSLARHQLSPFPSGLAEDSSTGLADEVCRLRKAQRSAGPSVAVVIGRHDSRPLTPAAKKRFGSNLGLAQKRAEAVARLLLDETTCSDSPPIDTIAIAVPNDRSLPRSMLDEQRRPEVLGLRIVLQSK